MRRLPTFAAGLCLIAGACDPSTHPRAMSTPPLEPLRLSAPDPGYRLSAADRARVRPGFDPEALERLIAHIQPSLRRMILRGFLVPTPEEMTSDPPPNWIVELRDPNLDAVDPVLQRLLEDVYAPLWAEVPDEALFGWEITYYPGQERERARRRARNAEGGNRGPGRTLAG